MEGFNFKFSFGDGGDPRPERKGRAPTKEEMTILGDLVSKAVSDTTKALRTTIDLASDTAGLAGLFLVVQKVMSSLMTGSALTLGAIRAQFDGRFLTQKEDVKMDNDDLLFVALLAYTSESKSTHKESLQAAAMMFTKITGRAYPLPSAWTG